MSIECEGIGQTVEITLKAIYSGQSLIKIEMGNFMNPNTTRPTSPFSISSFFSNGTLLEEGNPDKNVTFSASYGLMPAKGKFDLILSLFNDKH